MFYGLNAADSGLSTKWPYQLDEPGTDYRIADKHVAMVLGHYMIWQHAHHAGFERVAIMEDDVRLREGWRPIVESAVNALPPTWGLFYAGSCSVGALIRQVVGPLWQVQSAQCTHFYMVSKAALPVLLRECEKIFAPVDIAVKLAAIGRLESYALLPRVADQFGQPLMP